MKYGLNPRVQVIDLSLDRSDDNIRSWIKKHEPWFPVVKDVSARVFSQLKSANSIPQAFVVNCEGKLLKSFVGGWSQQKQQELRKTVNEALKTRCH